jgi:hypothetical protein
MVSGSQIREMTLGTVVAMMSLAFSASALAQSAAATPQDAASTAQPTANTNQAPTAGAKSANLTPAEARKAQILEDTNRLYRMAEELKAEVAKSNKDILSVAVVKKADEIEKLAKSLKERMRNE